jgi:hypothetical protein
VKIEISEIANGLLVTFSSSPTGSDPLAQYGAFGPIYCHDKMELMGRIGEWVSGHVPETRTLT